MRHTKIIPDLLKKIQFAIPEIESEMDPLANSGSRKKRNIQIVLPKRRKLRSLKLGKREKCKKKTYKRYQFLERICD